MSGLGRGGQPGCAVGGLAGGGERGREGVRTGEVGERALGRRLQLGCQRGLDGLQRGQVELRQLAQGTGPALGPAQLAEQPGPALRVDRGLAVRAADQRGGLLGRPGDGLGGPGRERADPGLLAAHLFGGVAQFDQGLQQSGAAQPVVPVGGLGAGVQDQRGVNRLGARGAADHVQAVGDAADQVGVADPLQRPVADGLGGGVLGGGEGGAPELRLMAAHRFAVRLEQGQRAVGQQRVAGAVQRGGGLAADGVPGQQQHLGRTRPAQYVQQVLPAQRGQHRVEAQPVRAVGAEGAVGAVGQFVAAREDQALFGREQPGPLGQRVLPADRSGTGVDDQVAVGGLVVGADGEDQQRRRDGVGDGRVGQALQRVVDRLLEQRPSVGCRVDGEAAAGGGDGDQALDHHPALLVLLATGAGPRQFEDRRAGQLALAVVVQVLGPTVGQLPLQDPDVAVLLAGAEHREQPGGRGRGGPEQLDQAGVAVVAQQLGQVAVEPLIVQQARHRARFQWTALGVVQREHALGQARRRRPQQQDAGPDRDDAAGRGLGGGAEPGRGRELQHGGAEDLLPAGVQLRRPAAELGRAVREPGPQDLEGAVLDAHGCSLLLCDAGVCRVTWRR